MKTATGVFLICAIFFSHANAEEKKVGYVFSSREFYKTAPGTLAFLPNVKIKGHVVNAAEYHVMPESGAYQLPKKQRYCFVVNHRASAAGNKTYLGVAIVPFMSIEHKDSTSIMYTSDWVRENDQQYLNKNGITKVLPIKINEFFQLHGSTADLSEFDDKLGAKWHGRIDGTQLESWRKRYLWNLESKLKEPSFPSNFHPPMTGENHKRIDALLINFSPTESYDTKKPVSFCFSGDSRKAVFLKTFAECSSEFEREYYLTFK